MQADPWASTAELDLHLTRRQLFGLLGARHRHRRARVAARPATCCAARRARRAIAKTGGLVGLPHFAPQPSASSSCTSPADRRSSRRSTTSRRSRSSRARRFPTRSARASASRRRWGSRLLPVARRSSRSRSTASRARGSASCCRTPRRSSTTSPSSRRCTPTRSITIRRSRSSRPGSSSRAGRAWARGSATASAARTRTCRRSSCCSRRRRRSTPISRCSRGCGRSGFLPSSYQGVRFRAGSDAGALSRRSARRHQGDAPRRCSMPSRELNTMKHAGVRRSGDRDAHRAVRDGVSHADLGAGADGSVEGAGLDVRAVRARRRASPAPTPPTACSRAGSPSATCASSSSITAAGTSTATCRATSRCSARAPISRPRRSSPI